MSETALQPEAMTAAQRIIALVELAELNLAWLGKPSVLAQFSEAVREGQIVAVAEWLRADDARLIAGRISRQTLNKAANAGAIRRQYIGDIPVFHRESINRAIAEGKLK